jgi:hypothetical protein
VGDEEIYKILEVNQTIVDFYRKDRDRREQSAIYIMGREVNGEEKLINSFSWETDLKSILNIIAKNKARTFA